MDGHGSDDRTGLTFAYRFLQRVFLEPDAEFFDFLRTNREALADLGIEAAADLDALRVEYTKLFLGPEGHLPPYESAFRAGRFWGRESTAVKEFLGRIGLRVAEDFRMPPDHIAIELEILERLLASDEPEAEAFYKRFFRDHLGWGLDLLEEVKRKTTSRFYRSSFEFAERFLNYERDRLEISFPRPLRASQD